MKKDENYVTGHRGVDLTLSLLVIYFLLKVC
ncbi:hypothetical protein PHYNN_243 [Pantoea phage Phynn]|nr:hypothetical protein PHYNN_243 [Pantoea phage Phynn]